MNLDPNMCGCGKPVRYMTPSGNACNKYQRCISYDEQRDGLGQRTRQLMSLLAFIHRDSGDHTLAVGIDQSLIDAEKILVRWRGAHDTLVEKYIMGNV